MPYRSCPNFGSEPQAVSDLYQVCLTQRPNKSHQLGTEPGNLSFGLHLNLKSGSERLHPATSSPSLFSTLAYTKEEMDVYLSEKYLLCPSLLSRILSLVCTASLLRITNISEAGCSVDGLSGY